VLDKVAKNSTCVEAVTPKIYLSRSRSSQK